MGTKPKMGTAKQISSMAPLQYGLGAPKAKLSTVASIETQTCSPLPWIKLLLLPCDQLPYGL